MSLDFSLYAEDQDGNEIEVLDKNITHNLGEMAQEAGIYDALWHPNKFGLARAAELVPALEKGLAAMKADPDKYKQYESTNGWGLYRNFVPWVEEVLEGCKQYPSASIWVSR